MRGLTILILVGCGTAERLPDSPGAHPDLGMAANTGSDLAVSTTPPSGMTFNDMCSGKSTTITGVVVAPNGHDPIANAFVYVALSHGSFPSTVSCELCNQPIDNASATTTSGPDGSFTLDIGAIPVTTKVDLTVNKGKFRHVGSATIQACTANATADTALPGKANAGVDDIPKIAVATGSQDQLDTVLASMGLDATAGFDCFEGRIPPAAGKTLKTLTTPCGKRSNLSFIESLLTNETMLESYDLVFLSCVPGKFKSLTATQQSTIVANLKTWTSKGGRLFVTDNSYDYLAQSFPDAVSFINGDTIIDAANQGVGGSTTAPAQYQGRINDPDLAKWMSTVGAVPSGSTAITLNGYLNKWSVIASVPSTTVDEVDATNGVAYVGPSPSPTPGPATVYPQSVKFDINSSTGDACGRAIYTSYHTLESTTTSVDPMVMLSPQERILEYLMFEASACIGPVS